MALLNLISEILSAPTVSEMVLEMIVFLTPVWIAFFLGILLGWGWKPWRTTNLRSNCKLDFPSSSGDTAAVPSLVNHSQVSRIPVAPLVEKEEITLASEENLISSSLQVKGQEPLAVTNEDYEHLRRLVERKDGGPVWKLMMERSAPDMSYQAWQRDTETGPPQYCSRTVYEDTTPELLRDFFWDDEFRLKWDDMILHAETLEECPSTGTMVVHWIRKFPFFCSDREYIIGRRIWESGRSYYCVTKGVPRDSIPRRDKPRRVDLYYSSWYIGPVESKKAEGELNACEVILFHHEDMGIPWEIAKFGIRQGMWGAVKKIERGIQMYKKERSSGAPLSHCATMAQISTKVNPDNLKYLENSEDSSEEAPVIPTSQKSEGINIPKLVIIGGVMAVACTLDQGFITKTIIFSVARKFASIGRKVSPRT